MEAFERKPHVTKPRRRHSPEFRQRVLAECDVPGVSVASVALRNNINANLIHNWRRKAREQDEQGSFLPLPLPAQAVTLADPGEHTTSDTVRLEIPTPQGQLVVHWPIRQLQHSISWLRALTQ